MNLETIVKNAIRNQNRNGRRQTVVLLPFAAMLLAGGAISTASIRANAADAPTSATDIIYVESNDTRANQNVIYAFRRTPDGAVAALPGSPFPLGGSGSFATRDSDQEVIVSPDQTLLFAVNPGSNTIAVQRIAADGSLTPVPGSPFPSGGLAPTTVGLSGNRLFVANLGGNGSLPNYTAFTVASNGALTPIPGSTVTVAPGARPSQALTTPQAPLLFGADFGAGNVQAFQVSASGTMRQSPNTPLHGDTPLGLTVHPTLPILYVGYVFASQLGVLTFDDLGTLTPVTRASNSGAAICWLAVTRDGKNLYSTNTSSNTVSWYDLTNPYAPIERQHVTPQGGGGPFQVAANAAGTYLYVVNGLNVNALHTFRIAADGSLTESGAPIPLPGGTALPQGVAVIQPPASVSGRIALDSIAPGAAAQQTLTFQFRPTDHSPGFTRQAALDANGNFTLTQIPPLAYNVWIKGEKWLAKTVPVDTTPGDATGINAALRGGDANNDNAVDVLDFGAIVNSYGSLQSDPTSGYDPTADFNGDGGVDVLDFGILVNNYGVRGDK